jgi:hypothetical protein
MSSCWTNDIFAGSLVNTVSYHHQGRVHDSLANDTPDQRAVERRPAAKATVVGMPSFGGLHHRYAWRAAA